MPEAAVNEDHRFFGVDDDVGRPRQRGVVNSMLQAESSKDRPDDSLR